MSSATTGGERKPVDPLAEEVLDRGGEPATTEPEAAAQPGRPTRSSASSPA